MTSAQGIAGMSKLLSGLTSPAGIAVAAVGTVILAFDKLTDSIAPNVSLLEKLFIAAQALTSPAAAMAGLMGAEVQAKADKGIITGKRQGIPFNELDASIAKANVSLQSEMQPTLVGIKQEMAFIGQKGVAAFDSLKPVVTSVNDGLTRTRDKGMQLVQSFASIGLNAGAVFRQVSMGLQQSFEAMLNGESFIDTLKQTIGGLIKRLLAAAAAAAILSAILSGLGIGAIGGAKTSFKGLFANISGMGAFANGGIVSSPTLGLVGEYAGARSNPEVIAPLDRLKSLMGDNAGQRNVQVGGEFRLRGEDLLVSLERAQKQRNRTS
jgi:hypothetical protein